VAVSWVRFVNAARNADSPVWPNRRYFDGNEWTGNLNVNGIATPGNGLLSYWSNLGVALEAPDGIETEDMEFNVLLPRSAQTNYTALPGEPGGEAGRYPMINGFVGSSLTGLTREGVDWIAPPGVIGSGTYPNPPGFGDSNPTRYWDGSRPNQLIDGVRFERDSVELPFEILP